MGDSPRHTLNGVVKQVGEVQSFGDKGFTKREFVVTVDGGKYDQDVPLELVKDKTGLADGLTPGQRVDVFFNIRGREYNGKHYVNLVAWKIDVVGGAPSKDADDGQGEFVNASTGEAADGDDNLPF